MVLPCVPLTSFTLERVSGCLELKPDQTLSLPVTVTVSSDWFGLGQLVDFPNSSSAKNTYLTSMVRPFQRSHQCVNKRRQRSTT
ncbi:hypothetical protein BaRGS_00000186 [Batillaria attramentaria]|uniref:Uncharacterized protein n=1 Tax=Batillaria attramentaria TaxID=370345 RepID=A0ABD0MBF3_9CAEN